MKNFLLLVFAFLILNNITFAQVLYWDPLENMPAALCWASSCTIDTNIYVVGGTTNVNSSVNDMYVYYPNSNSWDNTKAPMLTSRVEFCACAVNGKIYAIGGANKHNSGTPYNMVEEYDPSTDLWVTKSPMPTPLQAPACGIIGNKIYVAGGAETIGYNPSNKLLVYDPVTDTWADTLMPMDVAAYHPRGVVLNDKFYVTGGLIGSPWNGQKTVQIYDPATNTWSPGIEMPEGRVGHTANVLYGNIYAIGGDTQPPPVDSVAEYNPNSNSWTRIDSQPSVLILHTASVFENKIYIFGGSTTSVPGIIPTSAVYSFTPPISIPAAPILISPIDSVDSTEGEFIWTSSYPAIDWYLFEIDSTDQFATSFVDSMITGTTYIYSNLENGKNYWWRVKAHNSLGWGEFSAVATFTVIITSVEDENNILNVFNLQQNFPNPFNPTTSIKYQIPELSFVTLKVYGVLGNEITTLVNEEKSSGTYEVEFNAIELSSGIYFYRLQADDFFETKKMVLLR